MSWNSKGKKYIKKLFFVSWNPKEIKYVDMKSIKKERCFSFKGPETKASFYSPPSSLTICIFSFFYNFSKITICNSTSFMPLHFSLSKNPRQLLWPTAMIIISKDPLQRFPFGISLLGELTKASGTGGMCQQWSQQINTVRIWVLLYLLTWWHVGLMWLFWQAYSGYGKKVWR